MKLSRSPISYALAGGVALVAACASQSTEPRAAPEMLTELPRSLSAPERQIITAGNDFSFALLRRLSAAQPGANVFVSPLSASMALGMTMNGAANATFDAMRKTLGFDGTEQQSINAGYKGLTTLLRGLDKSTQIELANSIWYRQDFPFYPAFLDATRSWFDAEVSARNFADAPATLAAVNGWVNEKTHGKIPSILQDVGDGDVMYLINAIYFKGSWRQRFDAAATRDAPFHAADGGVQTARLMYKKDTLRYLETPELQAVDLPYGNGAFTMTVLLPKAGANLDAFVSSLTRSDWDRWTSEFQTRQIILHLPKVKLAYERVLNDDLAALGMGPAFDPRSADFSHMAPIDAQRLFISLVKQKAFVEIDEVGTEAAAATAVVISVTSLPSYPEMRVDRPFLFVIRERLSGTVLFMGKIVKMPG